MISTTVRPGFVGQLRLPQLLEFLVDRLALNVGIVRIEHGNQAGIGGALHVVLAAQGMKPGAGPADLPAHQRQRDQAAGVVGAVHMLRDAHAPEDHRALGAAEGAGHVADGLGVDAGDIGHRLGAVARHMLLQALEILGVGLKVLDVVEPLLDDHVHDGVEQRDVARGLELQHVGGVFAQRLAARIDDDELGAALRRLLEEGRGDRMVLGRIGADDHHHVGMLDLVEGRGHGARADALDQRRHRRGMAEPRAVIDIVVAEARADQLLEQIGFFVGAFGRAEAGNGFVAVLLGDLGEAGGGKVERLFPTRLAEMGVGVGGIDVDALGQARLPDQRLHQPLRIGHIVEAEAALDAEPVLIGVAVAALHEGDLLVLDLIGELTTDAAIGADRVNLAVDLAAAVLGDRVDDRFRHQRAGRAGLDALAAGDAGGASHGIVEIEHRPGSNAAKRHADDVVDLNLAAGPDAQPAFDAGIEIDRHGGVGKIGLDDAVGGKARGLDPLSLGPVPEWRDAVRRILARRLVGEQQLHHHAAGLDGAIGRGLHHHIRGGLSDARGGQDALAFDLDHAGPAVAVGAITGLRQPAEMRDVRAFALGDLPDGLAGSGRDHFTVESEEQLVCHRIVSLRRARLFRFPVVHPRRTAWPR